MSKLMIKCKQFWCVCCNSKTNTMRKIDGVRICTRCLDQINRNGNKIANDGGRFEKSKDVPGMINYIPGVGRVGGDQLE